jgi:hypothetical protein
LLLCDGTNLWCFVGYSSDVIVSSVVFAYLWHFDAMAISVLSCVWSYFVFAIECFVMFYRLGRGILFRVTLLVSSRSSICFWVFSI